MQAAMLTDRRKVEIRDVPEPALARPGDVLLDVVVVGVCGSDMHYYRTGRIGEMVVEYPFVVGHEFAGRVREVGPEARRLKVGDLVAVDPLRWCGRCDQCAAGRPHTCRNQSFLGCPGQAEGCLVERIVMPEDSCVAVPPTVTPEQAALLEPFSIGLYAQRLAGRLAGKAVGILGAGPIGLCVQTACLAAGAERIYTTDIREYRAEFARAYGAHWSGNPDRNDVVREILEAQPLGLDVVFECAGEQETIDQAVELLKPGGTLLLVGIPEADRVSVEIATARRKELLIRNVRRQNGCLEPAAEMLARREVHLDPLMTHHFPLERTQEAFDLVADYNDEVIKAMIHVTQA